MRLAEALSRRSDAQKRFLQLRARIEASARHQEGEEPAEDAAALLAEAEEVLVELEDLIRRINRTNAATELAPGRTITDGIAERDALRMRHALLTAAADAAAGKGQRSFRQLRSELREVAALPVAELRRRADEVAERLRALDASIQQRNWEVELLD